MRRLTPAGWLWSLYLAFLVVVIIVLSGCVTQQDAPLCFTARDGAIKCVVDEALCSTDTECLALGGE